MPVSEINVNKGTGFFLISTLLRDNKTIWCIWNFFFQNVISFENFSEDLLYIYAFDLSTENKPTPCIGKYDAIWLNTTISFVNQMYYNSPSKGKEAISARH